MKKRLAAAAALGVAVLLMTAAPALAHVTVDPSIATKGGFTKLSIRVPNEMDTANTVKVDVKFDENHPLASVSVKPKAGWTPQVIKKKLATPLQTDDGQVTEAVSEIVWSGGTIAPGQFDEFEVSVGPLPSNIDVLLFPTIQTYSDGTEVSWIQQAFDGQPEPDHPAPALHLVAAAGSKQKSSSSTNNTKNLAIAAFVIGSAGLGIGGWAWWNVRRWR
ncbi:MAG: hypothetical protein QOD92_3305 [Acidimicrobiaceae bacterium]|jgi:uncharacterized protein YcnI